MKTAFISGAARGIGFATARLLHEAGYKVFANYRTMTDDLAALCTDGVIGLCGDVCCGDDVARMIHSAGRIDVLVNNAGIAMVKPFTDTTVQDWDNIIAANLRSVFLCTQAVVPTMIFQKNGCIVNISSIWGEVGGSCEVAYSTAKAGVIGMTKALAKELGPSGIRVNAVSPGIINTDMNAELSPEDIAALCHATPLERFGAADDIAQTVLFLAENNFITGQVLRVDGGFCS